MRISKHVLEEGEQIPRFYGVSHIDIMRQEVICYLIPFNLISRGLRNLYNYIKCPSLTEIEMATSKAYIKGRAEGWRNGRKHAFDGILQQLEEQNRLRREHEQRKIG